MSKDYKQTKFFTPFVCYIHLISLNIDSQGQITLYRKHATVFYCSTLVHTQLQKRHPRHPPSPARPPQC